MGLVSNLFGAGSKAAYDTSGLASAVTDSNKLYEQMYGQSIDGGSPWLSLGTDAATALSTQLGGLTTPFSYDSFSADPSYRFLQDESAKAVERSASARGSLNSPSTQMALQDRSAALASTEYNNAFNRDLASKSSVFDMLMGASGVGQSQAAANAGYGQSYADSVSNNNIGLQNAILAARQSKNAATQSMLGNWINAGAKAAGAAAGASDRRVKHNVKRLGTKKGYPWYEFSYIGSDKRYEGVMAQDIQGLKPDAVVTIGGVLHVQYGKLGVEMREVV